MAADAGLRLDDAARPAIAPRLRAAGVDREVRGELDASDHAPAWIELAAAAKTARRPRR
jgi:exodeoxyribonuclease-3